MLNDLFQKSHDHHRSLPLLGPILDDFDDWLFGQGYRYSTRQCYLLRCTAIEKYFWRRKQRSLSLLTPEKLRECWQFYRRRPEGISHTVSCLRRFLQSRQILPAPIPPPATTFSAALDAYRQYLSEVRGLAPITIEQHCLTAAELLQYWLNQDGAFRFVDLTQEHIESFIRSVGPRFGRGSLQHVVGHIRGFLRFLGMRGDVPPGLDSQIDTPRVYRLEQLPRALPWEAVCAFLDSIDRTCVSGLRDYAMFLLIAAYGLRGCDIAGLKLTDVNWRAGELHVNQSKTRQPLRLPLTDPVARALLAYLRDGRPWSTYREIFLTVAAPIVPLKRQSAGYAFRFRVRRSGLDIAFRGVHCLRHSYAAHLLRQGVSLKGIGDVLGHRSTESTCVYLRLDFDALREVALPLPAGATEQRPS